MTHIPRIPVPSAQTFREQYLKPRRPVVISGLLAGHPLGRIDTLQLARERLGDIPVGVARNYMDMNVRNIADFVAGRPVRLEPEVLHSTLADYFDLVEREDGERWIVTENIPADSLLENIDLSPLGIADVEPGYGNPTGDFAAGKANSLMFAGGPGNASDLHTDWDGRHVVLYQIFGRKRAVLFPTEAAESMLPIDIFSMLRLRDMDPARRRALIESLGGYEVVLEPGDALFMPAFFWHHLEYIDTSMSVNFRFDGPSDPDVRFLINHLHRDAYTQNLLMALLDPEARLRHKDTLAALRAAYDRDYADGVQKYHAMRETCLAAYREICLQGGKHAPLTWVEYGDFLDPILSYRYNRPADAAEPAA